jgi:hypothetical protein
LGYEYVTAFFSGGSGSVHLVITGFNSQATGDFVQTNPGAQTSCVLGGVGSTNLTGSINYAHL